jgi:phytoene dehydrogenase-like protein
VRRHPAPAPALAGDRLRGRYRRRLEGYRYGPAAFKLDFALSGPIPWKAADCARAGTVHLGGTLAEIAASEAEVGRGRHPERPYVLLAQQSLFDPSRAPAGKHTAWAYCHVPNGSAVDMTERIEAQIERFAPGFRDLVLARSVLTPARLHELNPNYVGGDINGGAQDLGQMFTRPRRGSSPTPRRRAASTSARRPLRPEAASTGCADTTPRGRRCGPCSSGSPRRRLSPARRRRNRR